MSAQRRGDALPVEDHWIEAVQACFPRYRPPSEPDWELVRERLRRSFRFPPSDYEESELKIVMELLERSRPPLTAEELAPRLHGRLLELRAEGKGPFTQLDVTVEARCMTLPVLPGAIDQAFRRLVDSGQLGQHLGGVGGDLPLFTPVPRELAIALTAPGASEPALAAKQGAVGDRITCSASSATKPHPSPHPWAAHSTGQMVEGWSDIQEALCLEVSAATRKRLARYVRESDTPITKFHRRPRVDRGELMWWWRNLKDGAEAAKDRRVGEKESRSELSRHDALERLSMHPERRPNAKGKAR